jgi:hypothetical protein
MYRPVTTFVIIGVALSLAGVLPILRFLYFWSSGSSQGHIQSLLLGGVLVILGCVTFLAGLVADLIGFNRQLIEMTLEKVRRMEGGAQHPISRASSDYQAHGIDKGATESRHVQVRPRTPKRVS